ncbi:hypothetical protein [Arthrobacter crusticola]|uniref:hypothetical protein n=1 Tax=Arthrobacter crusticola TaxID=2547960 RepID=UPI001404B13E|nr:hypothetical protein [Arthrobacter crusticola]
MKSPLFRLAKSENFSFILIGISIVLGLLVSGTILFIRFAVPVLDQLVPVLARS